jgi:arylsulfatase A-like enzyme
MTPFRSEKNTNWEGAFRIPMLVRWPGKIKAGSVANGIVQHHDWLPTFLALAGATDVVEKLKKGYKAIGRTYKNHIDGFNLLPYLTGEVKESPRNFFFYISDDGDIIAMRFDNWKLIFLEQRCHGTMQVWAEPFTRLRMPKLFNLRTDPYEFADQTSNTYYDWFINNAYFIYAAQAGAAKFVETFKDFPPIQKPGSFTIDDAVAKMHEVSGSS